MLEFLKWIWEQFENYLWPFSIVHIYERGIRLTNGKYPKILNPGLHVKCPLFQQIVTEIVTPDTMQARAVHVTTKDSMTITVSPAIEYTIDDVVKWIIETNEARTNLHDILRGIVADYLTDLTWAECKLRTTRTEIKRRLNNRIKDIGANVSQVMLTDMCVNRVIITQI